MSVVEYQNRVYQILRTCESEGMTSKEISHALGGQISSAEVGQLLRIMSRSGLVMKYPMPGKNRIGLWFAIPTSENVTESTLCRVLGIACRLVHEFTYFSLDDIYRGLGFSPHSHYAWAHRSDYISFSRLAVILTKNGYGIDTRRRGKTKYTLAASIPRECRRHMNYETRVRRNQHTTNEAFIRRLRERMLEEPEFIIQVRAAISDVEKEVVGVVNCSGSSAAEMLI